MEEKKKGNGGLVVLVIVLLLLCIGMGAFIFINKDKVITKINNDGKESSDNQKVSNDCNCSNNSDLFKDDKIKTYYYETVQEGNVKCILTLGTVTKDNNFGYYTLRYISAYETGSEAPMSEGYFNINDKELKLTIGVSDENNPNVLNTNAVFGNLEANLEVDPEDDYRNSNPPTYSKMYKTTFDEEKITIGNKTFYRVD